MSAVYHYKIQTTTSYMIPTADKDFGYIEEDEDLKIIFIEPGRHGFDFYTYDNDGSITYHISNDETGED